MNILLANSAWYPTGGDWTYISLFKSVFEKNGHKIIPFSTKDVRNEPNDFEKYFIEKLDYNVLVKNKSFVNGLKVIRKSIYSFEAKKKLEILLKENKIDIAHFVNINNSLTPAIIPILKKSKIPIIWRLVDYKLICPNTTFLSNGVVCELCKNGHYYNCLLKKCKKKSILASSIATAESYFYKYYNVYKKVDLFSFQSEFTRDKFVEFGLDISRTIILPNPVEFEQIIPNYNHKKYVLFFGRIEKYKGIFTLLKSLQNLQDIELRIIGDGPDLKECEDLSNKLQLKNVKFLGSLWYEELQKQLNDCCFVIVPSEWYEPSPYSVLQSFASGKAVIGSRMGGIKDLIIEGKNGLLFEAEDERQLAEKIKWLYDNPSKIIEYGKNARIYIEQLHDKNTYYQESMKVFEKFGKYK